MIFFEWLDKINFLNIKTWNFSFHSILKDYGKEFFTRVILRHPKKTIKGLNKYRKLILHNETPEQIISSQEFFKKWKGGRDSIIGVGFCLKPLNPVCVSDRANHNCYFFEHNLHLQNYNIPDSCKNCTIKYIGLMSLLTGSSFYIMTSAKDILFDIFLPAIETQKFNKGLFGLCRYSFEPFKIGLLISGIDAYLFPYKSGDCQDYKTWLLADIGIKDDQTKFHSKDLDSIKKILTSSAELDSASFKFEKIGNIFYKF